MQPERNICDNAKPKATKARNFLSINVIIFACTYADYDNFQISYDGRQHRQAYEPIYPPQNMELN
jgi:hypothetical protein